jgi:hypothetical protein
MAYINHSEKFDASSSGRGEWDDEERAKYPISMLGVINGRSIMLPFFKPSWLAFIERTRVVRSSKNQSLSYPTTMKVQLGCSKYKVDP